MLLVLLLLMLLLLLLILLLWCCSPRVMKMSCARQSCCRSSIFYVNAIYLSVIFFFYLQAGKKIDLQKKKIYVKIKYGNLTCAGIMYIDDIVCLICVCVCIICIPTPIYTMLFYVGTWFYYSPRFTLWYIFELF